MRHRRVSCSFTSRAAALTGMAVTSAMMTASNSSVKPEPARAHGTAICLTPQSGQEMRATRACRKAWCWKKSRCRHSCMDVSCTGQSAVPHCGHGKRPPLAKSISISRRRLLHERNSHIARIKGLLILHGVRDYRLIERDWKERLDAVRTAEGEALPARAKIEIERECRRLWLAKQMLAE